MADDLIDSYLADLRTRLGTGATVDKAGAEPGGQSQRPLTRSPLSTARMWITPGLWTGSSSPAGPGERLAVWRHSPDPRS